MEENKIEERISKVKEETKELQEINTVANLIKSNEIEFEFAGVKYRAKKPSFRQKQLVQEERSKKYIVMLKDNTNLLETDLIALYQTRGIDIPEMDKKYDLLEKQKNDFALKLGKALTDGTAEEELIILRKELEQLSLDQKEIIVRKSVLLESSLESQMNVFLYTYLSFLLVEKLNPGKDLGEGNKEPASWGKAWNSYDDFLNEEEALVNTVIWYSTILTRNEISLM